MIRRSFLSLWDAVKSLLLHRHAWVRLLSSRLFGTLFAYRKEKRGLCAAFRQSSSAAAAASLNEDMEDEDEEEHEAHNEAGESDYLLIPRQLFDLAQAFCNQLESPYLTAEQGKQVVKNLFYVGMFLFPP